MCVCVCVCSVVSNSVTPWTVARQAPLLREFSRQEYWCELPIPPPGDLPDSGIEPESLLSPCIGRWILYHGAIREALSLVTQTKCGPSKMTGQRQLRNQPHYHKPRGRAILLGPFVCCFPPRRPLPNEVSCFVSPCVSSDNSFLNVRQEPTLGPW